MTPLFDLGLSRGPGGVVIGPRSVDGFTKDWRCTVWLPNGRQYRVGVRRGQRKRIAFKPRDQMWGFHWIGWVLAPDGESWSERVPKSCGVQGLLDYSGALPRPRCPQCRQPLKKAEIAAGAATCGRGWCERQEAIRRAAGEELA